MRGPLCAVVLGLFAPVAGGAACGGGVFVNAGANRGDNAERFYAGGYDAVLRDVVFHALAEEARNEGAAPKALPDVSDWAPQPHAFCAHLFEANPNWVPSLEALSRSKPLKAKLQAAGGAVAVHAPVAVAGPSGPRAVSFAVTRGATSWGAHIASADAEQSNRTVEVVTVSRLDLVSWVEANLPVRSPRHEWRDSAKRRLNVLVMDIEGAEYAILPALIGSGLACSRVDALVIEWHGGKHRAAGAATPPPNFEQAAEWILSECGVAVYVQVWSPVKIQAKLLRHNATDLLDFRFKRNGLSLDRRETFVEAALDWPSTKGYRPQPVTEGAKAILIHPLPNAAPGPPLGDHHHAHDKAAAQPRRPRPEPW
ncbi:hypothetical protein M885DRAFT_544764 [Pelagophyceae sp. CCMP2097]|nr:hypothetical protein M885DRAFT_544764 [Pelagophyceae sp. CCMP2097]